MCAMLKEPAVRLPVWVMPMLLSVIMGLLYVIYTSGLVVAGQQALKEHVDSLEQRLQRIEQVIQRK